MRLRFSEKPAEWRNFTWSSVAAMTLMAALGAWRGVVPIGVPLAIGGVALGVAVAAALRPAWFRGFYRAGRRVGHGMGTITGGVLLTLIFCLVVLPVGLVLRLAGKDPLRLKRTPGATSYWRPVRPPGDFRRMF
jgi:hypothetical protein